MSDKMLPGGSATRAARGVRAAGLATSPMRAPALAGALALAAALAATPVRADLVTDWSRDAAATTAPGPQPASAVLSERFPVSAVDMAIVHVALYDTLNAFAHRYEPFAAVPAVPLGGASVDAAVNEAAYRVLNAMFPSRSGVYQAQYDARMAAIADATARAKGMAVGADVAAQVLAWRAGDGRDVLVAWTDGTQPGQFKSRPGVPLVGRNNPGIRPFTLRSAAQFRPDGPPALGSVRYAEDFDEVKAEGIEDARSTRDADEDDLAKFHTEAPPVFWPRNVVRFARSASLLENARTLAAIWVAQADATIGCFEAKYHFDAWRPRTAIPEGETDGNAATIDDDGWLPNEVTPNHPEYPAAHSCVAGATMEIVRQVYGTKKVEFVIDSLVPGVVQKSRTYDSTDDFLKDVRSARIHGGMHFRYSTDDGAALGRSVAKWVMRNAFQER